MITHRHILLIRSTKLDDWRILPAQSCSEGNPTCQAVENAAASFLRPPAARGFVGKALSLIGFLITEALRIPVRDERRPSGYFWCDIDARGEFEIGRRLSENELSAYVPGYHRPHPNCRCTVAAIV